MNGLFMSRMLFCDVIAVNNLLDEGHMAGGAVVAGVLVALVISITAGAMAGSYGSDDGPGDGEDDGDDA